MSLDEAEQLLRNGAFFSDVASLLLVRDQARLRAWYVVEPGLPNVEARGPVLHTSEMLPKTTYVADRPCFKCGSEMFIPGRCPTCANCGESSGGCS